MRTNGLEVGERLRELLRAHVVADLDAPHNLSVFVGSADGPVQELHRLYRGPAVVVHTRSVGRLVRATVAHLDGFTAPPAGTIRLHARVLVRDGAAVLVSTALADQLDRIERRLERLGYQVADTHGAVIDPGSREVVLSPPRLEIDAAAMARLDREHPAESREYRSGPVRLPIVGLLLPAHDHDDEPASPARRLVSLAALIDAGDGSLRPADLEFVRRLGENRLVRRTSLFGEDRELVATLGAMT